MPDQEHESRQGPAMTLCPVYMSLQPDLRLTAFTGLLQDEDSLRMLYDRCRADVILEIAGRVGWGSAAGAIVGGPPVALAAAYAAFFWKRYRRAGYRASV